MMDGLFPLGFFLGNALCGYTKVYMGFLFNFGLGMLCALISMAYTLMFVKDSKELRDAKVAKQRKEELEELGDNEAEKQRRMLKWQKSKIGIL